MEPTAHTLEEAMNWFLENSSGCVTCVRANGWKKVCYSFPEAREFFETGN